MTTKHNFDSKRDQMLQTSSYIHFPIVHRTSRRGEDVGSVIYVHGA